MCRSLSNFLTSSVGTNECAKLQDMQQSDSNRTPKCRVANSQEKNRVLGISEKDPGSGLVQSWRFRIEKSVISLLGHRYPGSASSCLKTAEVVAVAMTVGLGSVCL
jgi:hypothetical protein